MCHYRWLDKLGIAAKYGVDLVVRQTFYGGKYGLLNKELNPTPVSNNGDRLTIIKGLPGRLINSSIAIVEGERGTYMYVPCSGRAKIK